MDNSGSAQNPSQDNVMINLRRKKRVRESKKKSNVPVVAPQTKCKLRLLKLLKIQAFMGLELDMLYLTEDQNDERNTEKNIVNQLKGSPLGIGTLDEFIDDNHAIVTSPIGFEYCVRIMSFVDKDRLEPGCTVLLNNKDHMIVGTMEGEADPLVSVMKLEKAPTETYADIGGLESQIQEIKESVELPLTNPELYSEMGITPPKGIILYGEPGTGKTLLAKAVANATSATFLRIVGSELIQKYLGDGPKLVREMFKVAENHAPSIIFIDEIDAIGQKRYDTDSSADKEIQRTMLELLNQLDGFDTHKEIKVIMATNNIGCLDTALIRPGRIDRKIHFGFPDAKTKISIFKIHTAKMTLADDVDITTLITNTTDINGSDIKTICTEAGMNALRERREVVCKKDFLFGFDKVMFSKKNTLPTGFYL